MKVYDDIPHVLVVVYVLRGMYIVGFNGGSPAMRTQVQLVPYEN
jgi:hypothetical protein